MRATLLDPDVILRVVKEWPEPGFFIAGRRE
jgi:hypothetical protein